MAESNSNPAQASAKSGHLRGLLAALLFALASVAMAAETIHTTALLHELLPLDRQIATARTASDARQKWKIRRFEAQVDRKSFQSVPIASFDPWLPSAMLTPAWSALLSPLLAIGYFLLAGKLARDARMRAWVRYLCGIVVPILGRDVPKLPASPPVSVAFFSWIRRVRPFAESAFGLLLLVDIAATTALARELRVRLVDPHYMHLQLGVHAAALAVAIIYFCFNCALNLFHRWNPTASSGSRRQILIGGVLIGIGALIQPIGISLAQLAWYRRVPNPRYRHHKPSARPLVKLPHGFYRNPQSGKIYFVDRSGRISTHDSLNTRRLVRISQITENDFSQLTLLTAKTCFEKQALSALRGNRLLDAVDWLELGVKYEIFRVTRDPNHRVNSRVVKLFAGLCYRHQLRGRIPTIRRLISQANLVPKFQPPPQHWLSKARQFKLRWQTRESYAGVPLLKP